MKKIVSKKAYQKALTDVYQFMQKGEKNITNKEVKIISCLVNPIQEYEKIHHPFPTPKSAKPLPKQKNVTI